MACHTCGESIRRRRPKPVKLPGSYTFNNHLSLDVFCCRDAANTQFSFLNIIDEGTGFQVVTCLGESRGPPASKAVLRHILTSWSSWAGLPRSIQVDRGREFLAQFADYLKQFGVEQEAMPLEAPWKQGKVEKAGGFWKEVMKKVVTESQIIGLQDIITATVIVTQIRNSQPRANGFAPTQWVLGLPEVRIPGSLRVDEDDDQLAMLEQAQDPTSAMAKNMSVRENARIAQINWTLIHESGELFFTNLHPQEDLFLWDPMSTSSDSKLVLMSGVTNGMDPGGLLELNFAILTAQKIKTFQLMVGNRMLTGFAMVHQLFWSLVSSCAMRAKMNSWQRM